MKNNPIFPSLPEFSQINQRYHGHCYFASALMSIANTMPLYLLYNMRDNQNGTVDVKLHDNAGKPIIYTIDKTDIIPENKQYQYHESADWFALYLKAYGIHLKREMKIENKNIIEITHHGFPEDAMRALTGIKNFPKEIDLLVTKHFHDEIYNSDWWKKLTDCKRRLLDMDSTKLPSVQQPQKDNMLIIVDKIQRTFESIIDKQVDKQTASSNRIATLQHQVDKLKEHLNAMTEREKLSDDIYNQDDEKIVIESIQQMQKMIARLEGIEQAFHTENKKDGANIDETISNEINTVVYQLIEQELNKGTFLTATTKQTFSLKGEDSVSEDSLEGHEEKTASGIAENHVYAILGLRERLVNGEMKMFVQVANPWGYYSVRQQWNDQAAELQHIAAHESPNQIQSHREYSTMLNAVLGEKKDASHAKFLSAEGLNGLANYSGVSEIEASQFVKYFTSIGACSQNKPLEHFINQCYIMIQHGINYHGQSQELADMFDNILPVMLDPNKDIVMRIAVVANFFKTPALDEYSNPIFNGLKPIMTDLFKTIYPRSQQNSTNPPTKSLIEDHLKNNTLPELKALGGRIQKYYLGSAIYPLENIKNYMQQRSSSPIAKEYLKILNDDSLSIVNKIRKIEDKSSEDHNSARNILGDKTIFLKIKLDLSGARHKLTHYINPAKSEFNPGLNNSTNTITSNFRNLHSEIVLTKTKAIRSFQKPAPPVLTVALANANITVLQQLLCGDSAERFWRQHGKPDKKGGAHRPLKVSEASAVLNKYKADDPIKCWRELNEIFTRSGEKSAIPSQRADVTTKLYNAIKLSNKNNSLLSSNEDIKKIANEIGSPLTFSTSPSPSQPPPRMRR